MQILISLFVVFHLLGMAAIFAGWLTLKLGTPKGLVWLVWGARTQLVTGLVLVLIHELSQHPVNHMKVGIKLVVSLAVVACAEISNAKARKQGQAPGSLVNAASGLALLNVLVAVLWQ